MKKLLSSLAVFCFLASASFAQQDPQFSQFMADRLSINPGVAGSQESICATLIGRKQWAGFSGQPNTALLNVYGPIPSIRSGIGLSVFLDEIGPQKLTNARLSYAYQLKLGGPTKLGLGISLGLISSSLSYNWSAYDYDGANQIGFGSGFGDESIPDGAVSSSSFDASFGAYLSNPKYYAGLSIVHLNAGKLEEMKIEMERHLYLMAGYNFELTPQLVLTPNVLAKTDLTSTQLDVNANLMYDNTFWIGVGYRLEDAISPQLGYQYQTPDGKSTLRIGYAYDVTTSNLNTYSNGSHEIMLGYCLRIEKPLPKRVYKNTRFL